MQTLTQSQATALIKAIQAHLEGGLFTKLDFGDVHEGGLFVNTEFGDIDGTPGTIRTWVRIPPAENDRTYSKAQSIQFNAERVCTAVNNTRTEADRPALTVAEVVELTLEVVRLAETFERPLEAFSRIPERPPSEDWLIDPTQW